MINIANGRIARVNTIYGVKFFDLKTQNKSFLKVARDLKMLGIKNYYWMLELKDPSIIKINPFQCDEEGHTTLSEDQISRIILECRRNPWYFLREIVRIPDQGGTAVPYRANRGNLAQAWCMKNGIDSWLCLPRQQGKTVSALCFQVWAYLFGTTNSKFIQVNKDGDNAKSNLRMMVNIIDLLPEYLRFKAYVDDEGKNHKAKENATELKNPITQNNVIVKPKATSYDSALSIARGLSASIIHIDEPEFTNHIGTIVKNSVSTFDTAAANAKKNNSIYFRCFTCTPTPRNLIA